MSGYDAIVLGLGGMGSAASFHLARRGLRVLGLEQFTPAHDRGSSHGQTRICRKAYFEHPDYVPLLHAAYDCWDELEALTGKKLFHRVGLLLLGDPRSELITGVRKAMAMHPLRIDTLDARALPARFAAFHPPAGFEMLFEADAGYLLVEECVRAHLDLARSHGAELRFGQTVLGWSADERGVRVTTAAETFEADKLVIAAGAWSGRLLRDVGAPLEVLRKMQMWFPCDDPRCDAAAGCPVFAYDDCDGFYYGFPRIAAAEMKIAEHTGREVVADPDAPDRSLRPDDGLRVGAFIRRVLPTASAAPARHAACLYTMSPDGHFFVDRAPHSPRVVFAAGFSGHGFKFAGLIGKVLADLSLDGATDQPIGFLRLRRVQS